MFIYLFESYFPYEYDLNVCLEVKHESYYPLIGRTKMLFDSGRMSAITWKIAFSPLYKGTHNRHTITTRKIVSITG